MQLGHCQPAGSLCTSSHQQYQYDATHQSLDADWLVDSVDPHQPLSSIYSHSHPYPEPHRYIRHGPTDGRDEDAGGSLTVWPPPSPTAASSLHLPCSPPSLSPVHQPLADSSSNGSSDGLPSPSLSPFLDSPTASADSVSAGSAASVAVLRAAAEAVAVPVAVAAAGGGAARGLARRRLCKCACIPCRSAKTACDESRPCTRCRTQRDPGLCCDRPGDDIERGRLKRRRKPNTTAATQLSLAHRQQQQQDQQPAQRQQQQPYNALPQYLVAPPLSAMAAPIPAPPLGRSHNTEQSSAACLAAARSTGMRDFLVGIVEQVMQAKSLNAVQRKKAVRAIQLGLAHMADHLNVQHFNAFLEASTTATSDTSITLSSTAPSVPLPIPPSDSVSSAPTSTHEPHPPLTPLPLPAILQPWSHPTKRPVFMEWSSTPFFCVTAEEAPLDADVATVRIRFLPAAKQNLLRWESQQQQQQQQQQQREEEGRSEADSSDISHINAKLGCLSMEDSPTPASNAAPSSVADSHSCRQRSHASWCSLQGSLLSLASDQSADDSTAVCSCGDSVALPCVMAVNAAWERLFGWSQSEVRSELLRCGMRAESVWYRLDSWLAYHVLLGRHFQSNNAGSNFRTFSIVRTKWGTELSCIVHKQLVCGDDGFTASTVTFTPITANA